MDIFPAVWVRKRFSERFLDSVEELVVKSKHISRAKWQTFSTKISKLAGGPIPTGEQEIIINIPRDSPHAFVWSSDSVFITRLSKSSLFRLDEATTTLQGQVVVVEGRIPKSAVMVANKKRGRSK